MIMEDEPLDSAAPIPFPQLSRLFQELAASEPPASLLSLPTELLVRIFELLVPQFAQPGVDWEHSYADLDDLRSLQLVDRRLHQIAQPITWRAVLLDGPEDEEEIGTAQLYRSSQEHGFVHALEWALPSNFGAMSVVVLPLLSSLHSLHLTTPEEHTLLPSYLSSAFAQLPSLRHLSLVGYTCFQDDDFRIADKIPSLESLELRSPWEEVGFVCQATNLRSLWVELDDHEMLATIIAWCLPSLEVLRIEGAEDEEIGISELVASIEAADYSAEDFATFPLHTLILDNLDSLHDNYLISGITAPSSSTPTITLLKLLPPILRLELLDCSCVLNKFSFAWSNSYFPTVQHLTVEAQYDEENGDRPILQENTLQGLISLLAPFPSLRTLTIIDFLHYLSPTALAATPIEDVGFEHSACLAALLDFVRRKTGVEMVVLRWLQVKKSIRCRREERGWSWELWWDQY